MLRTVPISVVTAISKTVIAAPLRDRAERLVQPAEVEAVAHRTQSLRLSGLSGTFSQASELCVELAVGEHLGDRVVDRLLQAVLVLVEADMRGRGQQLELLLRLQRFLLGQHLRADIIADHHQLGLAGDEGLDHGVVVVEALDVGRSGRSFGERGVLQRAAVDGDRLVGKVVLVLHLERGRTDNGDVVGRIGGGKVDDLVALLASSRRSSAYRRAFR